MLRLLQLPDSVKQLVQGGEISAGHARALLNAEDSEALAKEVAKKGLSVRETERLAQQVKQASKGQGAQKTRSKAPQKDPDTRQLEDDLSSLLGLKVNIEFHGQGGTLTVQYKTLDQLDDVLNRLNQHPGQKH
jgi:ParB family chromosome partitioning protein